MTFISSGWALLFGVLIAYFIGNPFHERTKKLANIFLPLSVMGLGAGMNLEVIGNVGLQGIGYTITGILITTLLGLLLGRFFNVSKHISLLITTGTAICGGSAIAAVAPVIKAKQEEISVSLAVVFILNALALFIFPSIGHHFQLTEEQFGLWSALAIHDTSSVVGATLQYGSNALEVGTTVKLARALWIIPFAASVSLLWSRNHQSDEPKGKIQIPWFIFGFIIIAGLVTWFPELQPIGHKVEFVARNLMVITLFLIGTSLTRATVKKVGLRPFLLAVSLWMIVATLSLVAILVGVIS